MTIYHKHHIIPKHMGGSDDPSNITRLTIEEHTEAHKILWEEYKCKEDWLAWQGLAGLLTKQEISEIIMRDNGYRTGTNSKGKPKSESHKKSLSKAQKEYHKHNPNNFAGKKHTEETKQKMRNYWAQRRKPLTTVDE
jgi:hypothetical protein